MSEFRFPCPECGQRILGDTAYSGVQVACPTCQKTITIPAAPPEVAAGGAPPPRGSVPPAASPSVSALSSAAQPQQDPDHFSALAVASLICAVFMPLGAIPGIICGHMAKARMRRNVFLVGEKMANAGLLISYGVLTVTLAVAATFLLEQWHFHPVKVILDSPAGVVGSQFRVVDDVVIGENEDDHDVDGVMDFMQTVRGKPFRSAVRGGSFSYMMKVLPHQAMTLDCRYWGGERGNHVFDIAVDGRIIATQDLTEVAPGHFFDMKYKIPASLTRGKTRVKVEFQAHPGMTAGALYGCRMLEW